MARKIKIKINDPKNNTKLNLPAMPFWLINTIFSIGISTKKFWIKDNNMDFCNNIDSTDLKFFLREIKYELKNYESFNLVHISNNDGSLINITVI